MNKREEYMYSQGIFMCDNCGEVEVNGPFTLCEACCGLCCEEEE